MRKFVVLATSVIAASLAIALPLTTSAAAQPGQVVARGHLAPGMQVRLYAWPASTSSLRPGQPVHRVLLGTATAGTTGRYELRAPAASLSAVAKGGYANLEADAGNMPRFFTWHATWTPNQAATATRPSTVNLNFSSRAPGSCSPWRLQKKLAPTWGIVGATYVLPRATHVDQSFTYLRGQVSSIGVDLLNGGGFTSDGTIAVKATASVAFPSSGKPGNNLYRTKFSMGKFTSKCTTGGTTVTEEEIRPIGFVGGKNVQHPAKAPAARKCLSVTKGETFSTGKQKAFNWTDGMTVNGAKISMQTGYDSSAQVSYKFSAKHQVCGTGGHSPTSAPLLVVKP